MELIFVLSEIFIQILFLNLFQVVKIVRAFWIYTLVNDEVLAVLFVNQSIEAVRTAQSHGSGKSAFIRGEGRGTDFAQNLSLGTVVLVEIWFWSITAGTLAVITNVTFRATLNRLYGFTIPPLNVFDVVRIVPNLKAEYLR